MEGVSRDRKVLGAKPQGMGLSALTEQGKGAPLPLSLWSTENQQLAVEEMLGMTGGDSVRNEVLMFSVHLVYSNLL